MAGMIMELSVHRPFLRFCASELETGNAAGGQQPTPVHWTKRVLYYSAAASQPAAAARSTHTSNTHVGNVAGAHAALLARKVLHAPDAAVALLLRQQLQLTILYK